MPAAKIYVEDLFYAKEIIERDQKVTCYYLYNKCYPLFKSIYDNYYTDCETVVEFINEIYTLILTPSEETGHCQLQNFRGESTLATWLKTTCLFYCYRKYKRRKEIDIIDLSPRDDDDDDYGDRILNNSCSTTFDMSSINRMDVETLLNRMTNKRYREIIRLRYVEGMDNEETAEALCMTMANFYNKHKLAKEQFISVLGKETGTK